MPRGASSGKSGRVVVRGGDSNLIGGAGSGGGNVIAYSGVGVDINGTGNRVSGNFIGTDASATLRWATVMASSSGAPAIASAAPRATATSSRGIPPASSSSAMATSWRGTSSGTDRSGTRALGNGTGVQVYAGAENTIGGTTSDARNLVSGNRFDGVELVDNARDNLVVGNYVGTDVSGSTALGNGLNGIYIVGGGNTIGGNRSRGTGGTADRRPTTACTSSPMRPIGSSATRSAPTPPSPRPWK